MDFKEQYNEYNILSGTYCLSLFITPMLHEIVLVILSIWYFHIKFSSIVSPRNFVFFTRSSSVPSKITDVFAISDSSLVSTLFWLHAVIFGVTSTIKFVLLAMTKSLFATNQMLTSSYSLLIKLIWLAISLWEYKIVVSSTNKIKSRTSEILVISLMWRTKSKRPKIEPCGTPQIIFFKLGNF